MASVECLTFGNPFNSMFFSLLTGTVFLPPSRANLDVLAKQVSVETQPVAGDIESSLQQDIP